MRHLDLFSGIGGFALAAHWAGFETIAFSEVDDYAIRVLTKWWPHVPNLGDIAGIDCEQFLNDHGPIDLITGGYPCQPYSASGKRRGDQDDRALWPQMRRVIEGIRPRWMVAENVPGIRGMALDGVLSDLDALGYATGTIIIPAAALSAPHARERVWILAHTDTPRRMQQRSAMPIQQECLAAECHGQAVADGHCYGPVHGKNEEQPAFAGIDAQCDFGANSKIAAHVKIHKTRKLPQRTPPNEPGHHRDYWGRVKPPVCRVDDGLPNRLHRIKGLGNAVVPQIPFQIFEWIKAAEKACQG